MQRIVGRLKNIMASLPSSNSNQRRANTVQFPKEWTGLFQSHRRAA